MTSAGAAAAAAAVVTARALQEEFETHVRDMKPHVLALRLKSERQKCALWIRRLCEVPPGAAARRLRNSYSRALLVMLKRGRFDPPFRTTPSSGPLPPLPAHLVQQIENAAAVDVPTWVTDLSLDDGGGALSSGHTILADCATRGAGSAATGRPSYEADADECSEIEAVLEAAAAASASSRYRSPSPAAVRAPPPSRSPVRASPLPRPASPAKALSGAGRSPDRSPGTAAATSTPGRQSALLQHSGGSGSRRRRSAYDRSSGSCTDETEGCEREPPSPFISAALSPSRQRQLQQLLATPRERPLPFRGGGGGGIVAADDEAGGSSGDGGDYYEGAGDVVGGESGGSDRCGGSDSRYAGRGDVASLLERPASPRKRGDRATSDFSADGGAMLMGDQTPIDGAPAPAGRRRSSSPLGRSGSRGSAYRARSVAPVERSPPVAASELDANLKAFESRLRVETAQLHVKHDSAIHKVLHKKNGEIEELRSRYESKLREQEEIIARLEKKVQTIVKDSALVRESKDQQIAELRSLTDDSVATRQNEFERRLHDLVAEHERDQFELQKQHTRVIQELSDEAAARVARLEADYKRQLAAAEDAARQLESKVHQLSAELDQLGRSRSASELHRAELEARLDEARREVDENKAKVEALTAEIEKEAEEQQRAAELARQKHDAQTNALRREHASALSRAGEVQAELERRVASLQQSLSDTAANAERRTTEMEAAARAELAASERRHEQKVRSLNAAAEQAAADHEQVAHSLRERLVERDASLQHLSEKLRLQTLQNEAALAELRAQNDERVEQTQRAGHQSLVQAEESAEKAKAAYELQLVQLSEQLSQLRHEHDKELASLRSQHELEKQQLAERERQQRDALATSHAQEMERTIASADADKAHLGEILRVTQEEYSSHAAELSDELAALRDEMATNEKLRRQQLAELRQLHDEERQRMSREHERDVSRLRAEAERQRAELQRAHASEMECLAQNHDTKTKQLEVDFTARLAKAAETAQELRALLEQVKAERQELAERAQAQLAESAALFDDERRSLRQQMSAAMLALQGDIEAQRDMLRHAERRLREAEADHEERLLRATLDYEAKMKGLMPASARQQLEDTIASLRSQVATLKQRVALLQGEQFEAKRLQLSGGGRALHSLLSQHEDVAPSTAAPSIKAPATLHSCAANGNCGISLSSSSATAIMAGVDGEEQFLASGAFGRAGAGSGCDASQSGSLTGSNSSTPGHVSA